MAMQLVLLCLNSIISEYSKSSAAWTLPGELWKPLPVLWETKISTLKWQTWGKRSWSFFKISPVTYQQTCETQTWRKRVSQGFICHILKLPEVSDFLYYCYLGLWDAQNHSFIIAFLILFFYLKMSNLNLYLNMQSWKLVMLTRSISGFH